MQNTKGSITTNNEGVESEDFLFTYSEEERQQNEINEANAKLVFNWRFLTIPREVFEMGLTGNDAIVMSFVLTYRGKNNRFYFTNKQLADMFGLSENGISAILTKLNKGKYINISYKRRAEGGLYRFITYPTHRNWEYQLTETGSCNSQKLGGNKNKNNNKILTSVEDFQKGKTFQHFEKCIDNDEFYKSLNSPLSRKVLLQEHKKAVNWLVSKGFERKYKNYRRFFMNWISDKEAQVTASEPETMTHSELMVYMKNLALKGTK